MNWVKAESFLLNVPVNLNSPFLPNLILQLHCVKHSTILFKQDCEIELGKSGEFFTQYTCEFKLSVFTQFNFTITLGKTLSAFTQTGL